MRNSASAPDCPSCLQIFAVAFGQRRMSQRHDDAQRLGGVVQHGLQARALAGIVGQRPGLLGW